METKGNKPDVFGENIYAGTPGGGQYTDYEIPPDALSDERFAAMIAEAEKIFRLPLCGAAALRVPALIVPGFVCWVINQSGVEMWGELPHKVFSTTQRQSHSSEAKPGILSFTGTYDSGSAVSHVGIYVGNGMMIHCGNPISYASVNTPYWQQHFYAYGRLP